MFVTIAIPAAAKQVVARHRRAAAGFKRAAARGVLAAAATGAEKGAEDIMTGRWGVTAQHGLDGLAGSVQPWMIDADIPVAAFGVPANAPAARYARMLEHGGTITPRSARALSIPISEEAKRYESPRDMAGLFMLKRPGRPPLLVRSVGGGTRARLVVHWVLMRSVTIVGRHWLARSARAARSAMRWALGKEVNAWRRAWNTGGGA
ncbi:MAG TPA: hypothetical protein VMW52_08660 [Phycisphaerae bacterium]|nr:hypothetical protein [Phycisphaerae bacterium]